MAGKAVLRCRESRDVDLFLGAVFGGLTTRALTEVIRDVVMPNPALAGLWHVSAEPIDKHTLLIKLASHLGWDVDITPSSR